MWQDVFKLQDILDEFDKLLDIVKHDQDDLLNKFTRTKIRDFRKVLNDDKQGFYIKIDLYKLTNPLTFFLKELYVKYYSSRRLRSKIKKLDDKVYLIYKEYKSLVYYNWLDSPNSSLESESDG